MTKPESPIPPEETVNRYEIIALEDAELCIDECKSGNWVKYKDIASRLASLTEKNESLEEKVKELEEKLKLPNDVYKAFDKGKNWDNYVKQQYGYYDELEEVTSKLTACESDLKSWKRSYADMKRMHYREHELAIAAEVKVINLKEEIEKLKNNGS